MILRWAIGDKNYLLLRGGISEDIRKRFWRMTWTSIESFKRFYPSAKFIVQCNGRDIDFWKKNIPEYCEFDLPSNHTEWKSYLFASPWAKWIPFRYNINDEELIIDHDVICLKKPELIESNLYGFEDKAPMPMDGNCGELTKFLDNYFPVINTGFIHLPPGLNLTKEFQSCYDISELDKGLSCIKHIAEQGCFNFMIKQYNIKIQVLDRMRIAYGDEPINDNTWLYHAIGSKWKLFKMLENGFLSECQPKINF